MIRLPKKRERERSGIERAPQREWRRHRSFLRRHTCIATLGIVHDDCDGQIVCAHIRLGADNPATSMKPHDAFAVPMCVKHHAEHHQGEASFARKYRLNMLRLAKEFALRSTVPEIREFAKTMPDDYTDWESRADRAPRGN